MNTEQEREAFKKHYGALFDLTETPDAWGNPRFSHESVEAIWYGWRDRAALQSQDREDAAHAEWMVDDGRAPWAINSLKDRIKEMRASEKRCRNAFRKDYMRVVSVYFADALGEAAEALEKRLSAIDHARRGEGEGE